MSARHLAACGAVILLAAACGSAGSAGADAHPSPSGPAATATPSEVAAFDTRLLTDLKTIDFQVYEAGITVGRYVFRGGALDYYKKSFSLDYSAMVIDEWKAVAFDGDGGKCTTQYPEYTWHCSLVATSPHGHRIYATPAGGLSGNPPNLADAYVELGTTVANLKGAAGNVPSLADVETMVDALTALTPDEVVRQNQRARDNSQHLLDTAASRLNFKTYLPTAQLQNFVLDRKVIDNPSDPAHPYLYLHFQRTAVGNQAFEFTVYEFRDDVPLSTAHCGVESPEIQLQQRCTPWFTTAHGAAVFSAYSTTLFDRAPTRIVINYSASTNGVTKAEMEPFVDSFVEVAPSTIPAPS